MATSVSPRAHVETIASRKIKGFLGTIDEDGLYYDPVHKQNQSLSQHIIADYHGRFLIELVQNGHDALPKDRRDGELAVLLAADEGESGTLYVANKGQPFQSGNVDALCEIGLSSKPPGEAVGNKGLGFRSVRHVSDAPEIFSRLIEGAGDGFDGYRFTFARDGDFDALVPDQKTRALARDDLPAFYVPKWIEDPPEGVCHFAAAGFSTVIRLPIRNAGALAAVRDEMVALARAEAPILLFLRRIGKLELRITGTTLAEDAFELLLTREETRFPDGTGLDLVDLGENGQFWVARAEIPEPQMRAAVAEGLESGALPHTWRGWRGAGEAAVAVPVGEELLDFHPRLYTFLPMGRGAASPLRGHLHGSFFPRSNRTSLDPSIGVNALVLEHAIRLAVDAAHCLTSRGSGEHETAISSGTAARASVDLVVWHTPESLIGDANDDEEDGLDLGATVATEIAGRWSAQSLADAPFVPCLGDAKGDGGHDSLGIVWRAPKISRRIVPIGSTFTLEAIARHGCGAGIAPVWPGLGQARVETLCEFLRDHCAGGFTERLTHGERGAIAEGLAVALASSSRNDWSAWRDFYRDLPAFMEGMAYALAGRSILICQDGTLRAARSRAAADAEGQAETKLPRRRSLLEPSVFMPPRRGETEESIGEEFYPPAPLRDFFAFLHDELPWYGDLAAARQFLEPNVAQPFESEALLTRISQIVERDRAKKVMIAGLRWAFAIWRRSVSVKRSVQLGTNYRFFVPTISGKFVRASDAVFSSAWPDRTLGHRLQQFLAIAPSSTDIEDLRARQLAPPSDAAFGTRNLDSWTEFLVGLGVQRGLQPRSAEIDEYVTAYRVTSFSFLDDFGIPQCFGELLLEDFKSRTGKQPALPSSTGYDIVDPLWWMPGQGDLDHFSDDALDAYATLIVEWVGGAQLRQLRTEVRHQHSYRSDSREWPTPLAAFLRTAAWVPCEEPSAEGMRRRRLKASEVWLAGQERYPPFLRRPSYKLMRALDRASENTIGALSRHAEFKTFNSDETLLDQIGFLTEQFAEGCVRGFYERELVNIYNRCWRRLAERQTQAGSGPPEQAPDRLLVRHGGQLGTKNVDDQSSEPFYVRDNADSIAIGLVEVMGEPLLDVRTSDPGSVGALVRKLYGAQVRLTSELDYDVHVGGIPLEELARGPRLVDQCPWLRPILAVALEALDSVDLNRLPADRSEIIQAMDRIEVQIQNSVSFLIDGQTVSPPGSRSSFQFERSEGEPVLIIVGEQSLTWGQVEAALPSIADAIRHNAVVPHMSLLVRQLALDGTPVDDRPAGQADIARLCRILNLDARSAAAARDSLGERMDQKLPWLRAIILTLGGEEMLERWLGGELSAAEDGHALLQLLRACLPDSAASAEGVLETVKASFAIGELRDRLNLDFAAFNSSLVATGSPPDVDPDGQAAQLTFFIQEQSVLILEALRNMVAPAILQFQVEPRYKVMREALAGLQPDPDWLPRFQRVPDELLEEYVASWLKAIGAPAIGGNHQRLADLSDVRRTNARMVRQVGLKAHPLVRAWAIQKAVALHPVWQDQEALEVELRRLLDDAGAFDCKGWSEPDLLTWFHALGLWPQGMPLSLDRVELGVAETEIEALERKARSDREERDREARSVRLNGQQRDPETVDWLKLSEEIAGMLPRGVLNRPIGTFVKLGGAKGKRGGGGAGKKGRGGAYSGVPQAKKDMIGRLGELTVYHWLRARQPTQDVDRCWVSSNANPFNGEEGNDGLGYDFRISFNKQIWFIEVKASVEDPCQFELGETEVRKARDIVRSRSAERYVIAYVANVGQTGITRIDILPNPFAPEADGLFRIGGNSIRYTFARQ